MLPNGVLSKHGYTTEWGFFSGICAGAEFLPFEQSTDQISAAMAKVESDIEATSKEIAELEDIFSNRNGGSEALVQIYVNEYRWVKANLEFSEKQYDGWVGYSARYTTVEKFRKRNYGAETANYSAQIEAYSEAATMPALRHWVCFQNTKFAKTLRQTNSSRRSWLSWQKERLSNWSVKPLIPREK